MRAVSIPALFLQILLIRQDDLKSTRIQSLNQPDPGDECAQKTSSAAPATIRFKFNYGYSLPAGFTRAPCVFLSGPPLKPAAMILGIAADLFYN